MSSDIAYKVFSALIFPIVLGILWWDAKRADSKPSKEPVPKAKELLSMLFPLESLLFIATFFLIGMANYDLMSLTTGEAPKIAATTALPGIAIELIYIFRNPKNRKVVTWHPVFLFFLFLGLGGLWQGLFIANYPPTTHLETIVYLPISATLLWLISRFNPIVYFSRKHIEKKARITET